MIRLAGNLPVLQVGKHHICGYDTEWIRQGLIHGAQKAGRTDFPFIEDVYDSIVHYLEHKCPLRLMSIEKLMQRIRFMLKRIGCEHIANAIPTMAPSITISLEEAASDLDQNYELGFFANLKSEIDHAKETGACALIFEDVKESVRKIMHKENWDNECVKLEEEILSFIEKIGETIRVPLMEKIYC